MLTHLIEECCKILRFSKNLVENSRIFKADNHEEYLLGLLRMVIEYRRNFEKRD